MPEEFYATPDWVTEAILPEIHVLTGEAGALYSVGRRPPSQWLEPCVGTGAIVTAVDAWRAAHGKDPVSWLTLDVTTYPGAPPPARQGDLRELAPELPSSRVSITNPPFSLGLELVQAVVENGLAEIAVFLLPLHFLGTERRGAWLREHLPRVYVLPRRPRFVGGGTIPRAEYAWMIWAEGRPSSIRILPVPPKP